MTWDLITKNMVCRQENPKERAVENKHSILIAGEESEALAQIILWGEASWWPKNCLMRFDRLTRGVVCRGTKYRQKVLLPFGPAWDVVVEDVSSNSIRRKFLSGIFSGTETVSCQAQSDRILIRYEMSASLNGSLNAFLWRWVFRRLHDRSIEDILKSLKQFLEKR